MFGEQQSPLSGSKDIGDLEDVLGSSHGNKGALVAMNHHVSEASRLRDEPWDDYGHIESAAQDFQEASNVNPIESVQFPTDKDEFMPWLDARKSQWRKARDDMSALRAPGRKYGVSIKDTLRGSSEVGTTIQVKPTVAISE